MLNSELRGRRRLRIVPGLAVVVAVAWLAGVGGLVAAQQLEDSLVELAWAYAIPTEPRPQVVNDGGKQSLPGTPLTFTRDEIMGRDSDGRLTLAPADWYPGDHPVMPEIVSTGDSSRGILACALCHYPNGKGRPENANPAAFQGLLHPADARLPE